MSDVLKLFAPKTEYWFRDRLGEPTAVQKQAWPAIQNGRHTLVSAPTGTGKTLAAFLVYLDWLIQLDKEGKLKEELYLIYVSPLKSLAADIRENLRKPLEGIDEKNTIQVGIRTGDTTQKERQQMLKRPPHILITTPESLYLMLTGKNSRRMLQTAKAVILDELHALIDTKRGAHLMLSLARLDDLCGEPLQRIGLSATLKPLELAAEYLAPEDVVIAAPKMKKDVELQILAPFAEQKRGSARDPIWEELASLVYRKCQGNRSVIAFVEGRRYAEKLAYYVNLLGGEEFARVHHGSLSKEQRLQVESDLRNGSLRLLCATSSMELGIDVGQIDQVLQVGCPRTISGTMQRLGRAGHNPGRTSVMYLFPRTAAECVSCGMTAQLAREGGVEHLNPPELCLDVLAQHLVSMAACGSYEVEYVLEILKRAWPFRNVSKEDIKALLEMLAGDYEHERDIPARPRLLYDRIHERVEGDAYSRMLSVSAGGTIPDKGLFAVKTENGIKIGEVDEEFVYESRKGDRFLLGAFGWKILDISRDTVTVTQSHAEGARLPFWHGELKGRSKATGEAFGRILRNIQEAEEAGKISDCLKKLGLDEAGIIQAEGYLKRQIEATGCLPDDRTVIVERFRDNNGNSQIMFHSVFGKRINSPLALLLAREASERMGRNVGSVDEEDGILLYSYSEETLPENLLYQISAKRCRTVLEAMLPATPLFNIAFRYNSSRALMMGIRKNSRQPLWMQRLRSAEMLDQIVREKEHPLIRETKRECLEDLWDIDGLIELLNDIKAGKINVREIETEIPSPMSLPLQWSQEAAVMYDYTPTPKGIQNAVEEALQAELVTRNMDTGLIPEKEQLIHAMDERKIPEDQNQLHSLLMTEGDQTAGELDDLFGMNDEAADWISDLAENGRIIYLEEPGLWIAAEQEHDYIQLYDQQEGHETAKRIVRRMLRYHGGATVEQIAERYLLEKEYLQGILTELIDNESVVERDGCYYHTVLYSRARRQLLKYRRDEIHTVPGENYAALLADRVKRNPSAAEGIKEILNRFAGASLICSLWETVIFPVRIRNYRENLLDAVLAEGDYFWYMEPDGKLSFNRTEDIDWDEAPIGDSPEIYDSLSEKEKLIYQALRKRGASFMQTLNNTIPGESPYDTLMTLMEKGIVYADSFVPVRQYLNRTKLNRTTANQRVHAKVKAFSSGRWDLVRPEKKKREFLNPVFDRYLIACRETANMCGISWQEALNLLRIQEYTGQVRRGYFVKGLSGAQFIRSSEFESIINQLKHPLNEVLWLNAADPWQCWGKLIPHYAGNEFMNVFGSVVAIRCGIPAVVFEKQGKTLRIMYDMEEKKDLQDIFCRFAEEFRRGSIYGQQKRIVVKEFPKEAEEYLRQAGFFREMQDYVLYR